MFFDTNKLKSLIYSLPINDLKILIESLKFAKSKISEDVKVEFDHKELSPQEVIDLMILDIEKEISDKKMAELVHQAVSEGKTMIPEDRWGVHAAHCCKIFGCKYGALDCPVVLHLIEQKYQCEGCEFYEETACSFKKNTD